jgi:Phosphotransferase enzyme family
MSTTPRLAPFYPDAGTLAAGLGSLFGTVPADLVVLERSPNVFTSTFASEIVRFRVADGAERRVLCKYDAIVSPHRGQHRGGVGYEGAVYRDILAPLRATAPMFYGLYEDAAGQAWLVVEYVADGMRLPKTAGCERHMTAAARWIGEFHAAAEEQYQSAASRSLRRYDAAYYRGWANRTWSYTGRERTRFPWLRALCACYNDVVPAMAAQPTSVIHGEYYPENILIRTDSGVVCPVDWEATAIGAGEVDVASLVDGWPEHVVQECGSTYQQARWPGGAPEGFQERMRVAQLYWLFRWMGDRPHWTTSEAARCRFEQLRSIGEQLGVI